MHSLIELFKPSSLCLCQAAISGCIVNPTESKFTQAAASYRICVVYSRCVLIPEITVSSRAKYPNGAATLLLWCN